MDWILVAVVAGGILTSGHPTREACEGRVFTLKEQKIHARCVETPAPSVTFTTFGTSGLTCTPSCR